MYELFWIFLLYAFLGWCAEVIFAAVKTGEFVNRGFLLGPVCPIYGLGVSFVLLALKPLGDNLAVLFLSSVVITSALEFFVGWLAEKLLGQRLWDYSDMPFNLKGYICPAFSLMWGVACILVIRVIHPLILSLIRWLPHKLGLVLLGICAALFIADLILTLVNALRLPRQYQAAEELERLIRGLSDGLGSHLYQGVTKLEPEEKKQELARKKQDLEEQLARYRTVIGSNRTYRRLSRAFPHLRKSAHHRRLETICTYLEQHRSRERKELP